MATVDTARKFSEHAIKVERVFAKTGIAGNAALVLYVLAMAKMKSGVPQKEVVEGTALPKDVVSKVVRSLVRAKMLTQKREVADSRIKRLWVTDSGRALLSRFIEALQPSRPAKQSGKGVQAAVNEPGFDFDKLLSGDSD